MPPKPTKKTGGPVKKTAAPTKKPTDSKPHAPVAAKQETLKEAKPLPEVEVPLKEISKAIIQDQGGKIKESGRWPLIIDPSERCATFLKYQDVNYINAVSPDDMKPETLRRSLLGSLRYGKHLVIDMMENDMYQTVSEVMDMILPGLLGMIMDKSILSEEAALKIAKESDGEEYKQWKWSDDNFARFMMVFLTSNMTPPPAMLSKTIVFRVM